MATPASPPAAAAPWPAPEAALPASPAAGPGARGRESSPVPGRRAAGRLAAKGAVPLLAALLAGCGITPCIQLKPEPYAYEKLLVMDVEVARAPDDAPEVVALRRDWSAPERWSDGRGALYAEAPAWRVRWIVRDARLGQCAGDARLYEALHIVSCDLGLALHVADETLQIGGTDLALPAGDRVIEAILIDPSLELDDAPEGRIAQVCPLLMYTDALSVRSFDLPPTTLPD